MLSSTWSFYLQFDRDTFGNEKVDAHGRIFWDSQALNDTPFPVSFSAVKTWETPVCVGVCIRRESYIPTFNMKGNKLWADLVHWRPDKRLIETIIDPWNVLQQEAPISNNR